MNLKEFTHSESWTAGFGNHPQEDVCSFEFLQKTSHVLQGVGNNNLLVIRAFA